MKNLKGILIVAMMVAAVVACTDMDDYLKYTGGKELIYTGRVDSVHARAGNNRVVITGLLIADPKIVKLKIYWNIRQDSLILDIERSAGVDSLSIPIALPEGRYNFELITYDAAGNSSVTVFAGGSSYGVNYQESLINRPLRAVEVMSDTEVRVRMYTSDETALFTEIRYMGADDVERVVRVKGDMDSVALLDYKRSTKFSYQTYYKPEKLAIDTFKAAIEYIGATNITRAYFKNPGKPFKRGDSGNQKWGTPKDWLFNPAATNQNGGQGGGWSWDEGGVIHFETQDWSGAGVDNGKVWQTFILPAGTYTMSFETGNCGGSPFDVYEIIAEGSELPDINNIGTPLALFHATNVDDLRGTHDLTFTLEEAKPVAIGWVISTGQNVYLQFRSVKLVVHPEDSN
ncbi:DUF4998 domain-containing protein [Dawidia soli]|uniref:DUF5013 domain-containing protein n=1 Tax=Dawidia soli TaxID=2782352 RepID=A0AAP2D7T1_9BACT|nr:DUF4998 domain-containing protein [Dawidia soli]MBT1685605.1 DUF5013 domain-containing protein [Dawidia soli]